jgi:hypothetical protein
MVSWTRLTGKNRRKLFCSVLQWRYIAGLTKASLSGLPSMLLHYAGVIYGAGEITIRLERCFKDGKLWVFKPTKRNNKMMYQFRARVKVPKATVIPDSEPHLSMPDKHARGERKKLSLSTSAPKAGPGRAINTTE